MKKFLSFAAALALAVSSFTPLVSAENRFGIDDEATVSDIPLSIESSYDYWKEAKYAEHTADTPMRADVSSGDASTNFSSKATLEMTSVAEKWAEYVKKARDNGVTLSDDNTKLDGSFTVTVKYDGGISNAAPEVVLDDHTKNYFEVSSTNKETPGEFVVNFTLTAPYSELVGYFNDIKPITVSIATSTVTGAGTVYEVSAELKGSILINKGLLKVNFESEKAADYLLLVTPRPYVAPTAAPTAAPEDPTPTPIATIAPAARATVKPADLYTKLDEVDTEDGTDAYDGFGENTALQAVVIDVVKENGEVAVYGEDYYASYGTVTLSERDYELLKSGNTEDVSQEVKDAIGDSTPEEIIDGITIITDKDSNVSVNVSPVYENNNGELEVLEGLGDSTTVKEEEPTPTPTPTRRPSRGGGGGGGSSATPTPAATEAAATEAPTQGTDAQLEINDHFAYIIGYNDGTVKPENNITRAEVATIFFRLLTDDSRVKYWTTENNFTDVSSEMWFNNAISTVANAGIVNGYDDGTFKPDAPITRAEFATIASRFAASDGTIAAAFKDISGHWAEAYIRKAASVGWVTGYDEDNTFRPNNNITRAEAMTIINRVTYRIVDAAGISADAVKWPDNPASAWYYANVEEATNAHTYSREALGSTEAWGGLKDQRDWEMLEKETASKAAAAIIGSDNGAIDLEDSSVVVSE